MPEIDPLTAEEIVFVRRLYKIRQRMMLVFWGMVAAGIGSAVMAAVMG